MTTTPTFRSPRRAALAILLVAAAGCPASSPPEERTATDWDRELRGKRLVHVHDDDAERKDLMWLCSDGTAAGRWDVPAADQGGPTSADDLARWSLREEDGNACLGMAFEEDGVEIDAPCVMIEPDGDGFLLEDRRWVVAGEAGC